MQSSHTHKAGDRTIKYMALSSLVTMRGAELLMRMHLTNIDAEHEFIRSDLVEFLVSAPDQMIVLS
jgi:hypothetical protein